MKFVIFAAAAIFLGAVGYVVKRALNAIDEAVRWFS